MANESLGIIEELQARRLTYARFAYKAPLGAGAKAKTKIPRLVVVEAPHLKAVTGTNVEAAALRHRVAELTRYTAQLERQIEGEPDVPVPIIDVQRAFLILLAEAEYFLNGKPVELYQLQSPSRHRSIAWPRHVCMDAVRQICLSSLPMIGRHFGKRDHTSVMHAIRRTPYHLVAVPVLADIHAKLLARWAVR